jgi:hypothetical protein
MKFKAISVKSKHIRPESAVSSVSHVLPTHPSGLNSSQFFSLLQAHSIGVPLKMLLLTEPEHFPPHLSAF